MGAPPKTIGIQNPEVVAKPVYGEAIARNIALKYVYTFIHMPSKEISICAQPAVANNKLDLQK